jgi:hypothetical protein
MEVFLMRNFLFFSQKYAARIRSYVCRNAFIMALSVLALSGCGSKSLYGLSLGLGGYERGLWFDADERNKAFCPVGLKFDLVMGDVIRPVPKFWERGNNPWQGDEPWFVLRFPMVAPFVSVAAGDLGVYLGFKSFAVTDKHHHGRYEKWMKDREFGTDAEPAYYLTPTASLRRTRWK